MKRGKEQKLKREKKNMDKYYQIGVWSSCDQVCTIHTIINAVINPLSTFCMEKLKTLNHVGDKLMVGCIVTNRMYFI